MSLPQKKAVILPLSQERRRFQRVRVNLLGRYMLADRREFPCQVSNMSPGGMALIAPVGGQPGERVIAYVDHVGRLEGKIARQFQNVSSQCATRLIFSSGDILRYPSVSRARMAAGVSFIREAYHAE